MDSETMSQIMELFTQLRQENSQLRHQMDTLQHNHTLTSSKPLASPKFSLPEKFDGSRKRLRAFVNQVRLIIRMQADRYPDDVHQVGLLGSLLTGPAANWFAPLIETNSPLLANFENFLENLEATFGDTDRVRSAEGKLKALRQGGHPASQYASEFRLIAGDTNWNDDALMAQFRLGLHDDVKDLLLTMEDPHTLQQLITIAVKCDNRLFERRMERQGRLRASDRLPAPPTSSFHSVNTHKPTYSRPPPPPTLPPGDPMQVDSTKVKHLTPGEKARRRQQNLCLYCGKPGHFAPNCPEKSRIPFNRPSHKAYSGQTSLQTSISSSSSPQENSLTHLQ